jgi:hypothetical protein
MRITRPLKTEYVAGFEEFVSLVPETDALPVLGAQSALLRTTLSGVSEERSLFRYDPAKWSIRQVIGHTIDAERVCGYRLLCIARGESASLPGFEESEYAANAGHEHCHLASLLSEFESLRQSHVLMLRHLPGDALMRIGTANDNPITVRALAFVLAGHIRHHIAVLTSRYGVGSGA